MGCEGGGHPQVETRTLGGADARSRGTQEEEDGTSLEGSPGLPRGLGQTALSISDLHHSMLWMQQVLKQLNAGEYSTVSKVQVLNHLSDISFRLGDLYRAVDFTHQLLSLGNTLGS